MKKISIFCEQANTRLNYVTRFIQQYTPFYSWQTTNVLFEYQNFEGISINYSKKRIKKREYFISDSGWLYKELKNQYTVPIRNKGRDFQIFPETHGDSFDVFAAIFYLLSRCEEYNTTQLDHHGRFPAEQSILYSNEALTIPIIDIWVRELMSNLESMFEEPFLITAHRPSWSLGVDVDQFFKYQHKGLLKYIGGLIKSVSRLRISECIQRIKIVNNKQKDPFNTFEIFRNLNIDKSQLFFFILSGGHSRYDKNHSLRQSIISKLILHLSEFATIGLHPSYSSHLNYNDLQVEKRLLESCVDSEIIHSRNHYLKMSLPETYQNLLKLGIQKDYSMGYVSTPGFRAGTCREFYWYDLEKEKETDLKICPLVAMDRTFLEHLKLSPQDAKKEIIYFFEICMSYGGHFHLNWHNSSFDFMCEWKQWDGILESVVDYFKSYNSKIFHQADSK